MKAKKALKRQTKRFSENRVFREDLVLFVNSCFAATGQATFYRSEWEARLGIDFVHDYMCANYREIYPLCLALGINDFNTALIIFKLLQKPLHGKIDGAQRKREGELIRHALRRLPPQRVYRLFSKLRRTRVNNRRTRAVIRDYLSWRNRWDFDAMKYRRGLSDAARHAHLPVDAIAELGTFLFRWKSQPRFEHDVLENWRAAHYSQKAMYTLPYTVAEGFATKHGVPRDRFLKLIEPQMTRRERTRLIRSTSKLGVDTNVDLSDMALLPLATFVLSMPMNERVARLHELEHALVSAGLKAARKAGVERAKTDLRVAAVLDNSYSSKGARQTKNRALAVSLGVDYLLRTTFRDYTSFWTSPPGDASQAVFISARGQTPIAQKLVEALKTNPDLLIVISDGWENDPPGATSAVLELFRRDLDPHGRCAFVHGNPVFDTATYEPKRLSPLMPTVGLRTPADLLTMLPFTRFASGHQSTSSLIAFLKGRADTFIEPKEHS